MIYFVQSGKAGPIKVGVATNLGKRLLSLQSGNPQPITVLATCPGSFAEEKAVLDTLWRERLQGEWHKPSALVHGFIEVVRLKGLPAALHWAALVQEHADATLAERRAAGLVRLFRGRIAGGDDAMFARHNWASMRRAKERAKGAALKARIVAAKLRRAA
jgi:hypothetical protein